MRKARILAASAAALALALALAGCSGGAGSSAASSASVASESASASSTAQQQDATVHIDTEGMGAIAWSYEGEEPVFDDDAPIQSAVINDAFGQTIHIEAKDLAEYEGYHFTKWKKDGADFSTDNRIDVQVDGDANYVAVFEFSDNASESSASESGTAGSAIPLKDNLDEAKYQIEVAMQYQLEQAYGDKVNDARIYVEKVYTAEEEQADETLKSYNLDPNEVAFEVKYELHPADGADVNELTAATGVYDEKTGWIKEKYNVGILRPNASGDPAYVITDFGTAF